MSTAYTDFRYSLIPTYYLKPSPNLPTLQQYSHHTWAAPSPPSPTL